MLDFWNILTIVGCREEEEGGGSKREKRAMQVSPLFLAELSGEMKAVYQPILLCKGCKMHLSCFTDCRSYYPL